MDFYVFIYKCVSFKKIQTNLIILITIIKVVNNHYLLA